MSTEENKIPKVPEVDGPCECGKEATHKHLDDKKNYCDECCLRMMESL